MWEALTQHHTVDLDCVDNVTLLPHIRWQIQWNCAWFKKKKSLSFIKTGAPSLTCLCCSSQSVASTGCTRRSFCSDTTRPRTTSCSCWGRPLRSKMETWLRWCSQVTALDLFSVYTFEKTKRFISWPSVLVCFYVTLVKHCIGLVFSLFWLGLFLSDWGHFS